MKKAAVYLLAGPMSLLWSLSFAELSFVELTIDEAKKKTFSGNICEKKYDVFIKFPNQTSSTPFDEDEKDSKGKADKAVADTHAACLETEKEIKEALQAVKRAWYKQCKLYSCTPGSHASSSFYSKDTGATNCLYGEVTVSNRGNDAMFCNYPVRSGAAYPKKFADRETERCHDGEDGGQAGYGGVNVSIPSSHYSAKEYLYLTCIDKTIGSIDLNRIKYLDAPVVPGGGSDDDSDDDGSKKVEGDGSKDGGKDGGMDDKDGVMDFLDGAMDAEDGVIDYQNGEMDL